MQYDDQPESEMQRSLLALSHGKDEAADGEDQHRRKYKETARGADQIPEQCFFKARINDARGKKQVVRRQQRTPYQDVVGDPGDGDRCRPI